MKNLKELIDTKIGCHFILTASHNWSHSKTYCIYLLKEEYNITAHYQLPSHSGINAPAFRHAKMSYGSINHSI